MDLRILALLRNPTLLLNYQEYARRLPPPPRLYEGPPFNDHERRYDETTRILESKVNYVTGNNSNIDLLENCMLYTKQRIAPFTLNAAVIFLILALCAFALTVILHIVLVPIEFKTAVELHSYYCSFIGLLIKIFVGGATGLGLLGVCIDIPATCHLRQSAHTLISDAKQEPKDFVKNKLPHTKSFLESYLKSRFGLFRLLPEDPPMWTPTRNALVRSVIVLDEKWLDSKDNENIKLMLQGYQIIDKPNVHIEVLPDNASASAVVKPADGKPDVPDGKVAATDNRGVAPLNP